MMEEPVREALSFGERVTEGIAIKTLFTIRVFGLEIPISDTVVWTWIVMAVLTVLAVLGGRKLKEVPRGFQVLVEAFVGFINDFAKQYLGHNWKTYAPFLLTVGLYLGVANMAPIVTPMGGFGFEPLFTIKPPTRDINVTTALAVTTILIVLCSSLKQKGPIGWLKGLFKPMPFMLPFNLLEYVIRPLSLSLRLFGNILGAFILMQLVECFLPVAVPPILGLYFDLFDGFVQAVVFTFLTTIYIAEAVE